MSLCVIIFQVLQSLPVVSVTCIHRVEIFFFFFEIFFHAYRIIGWFQALICCLLLLFDWRPKSLLSTRPPRRGTTPTAELLPTPGTTFCAAQPQWPRWKPASSAAWSSRPTTEDPSRASSSSTRTGTGAGRAEAGATSPRPTWPSLTFGLDSTKTIDDEQASRSCEYMTRTQKNGIWSSPLLGLFFWLFFFVIYSRPFSLHSSVAFLFSFNGPWTTYGSYADITSYFSISTQQRSLFLFY